MIVHDGSFLAYLGGAYGETLYLSEGGSAPEPVRSFGLVAPDAAAAQRRLLLAGDDLFVLEPESGVLFGAGDLRVRRFDRSGRERGEEVGPGEEGRAQLAVRSQQDGEGAPWTVELYGVDPARGTPLRWRRELPSRFTRRPWSRRGSPVWRGDEVFVPVHNACLLVYEGERRRELRLRPGLVQPLRDRILVLAHADDHTDAFVDEVRRPLPGPPLWPHLREYRGPGAVERADGSLVFLRADGGDLPALDGAPGRLPPGLYDGLVSLDAGVFGLEIARGPRLVRAEL